MLNRAIDGLWDVWSAPYISEPRLLAVIGALSGVANQGRPNVVRMITVVTRGCDVEQVDEAAKAVEGLGAPIFPLLVRDLDAKAPDFYTKTEYLPCNDKGVLASIARKSGGRVSSIVPVNDLNSTFEKIVQALRNQVQNGYVAGFYGPSSGERKAHKIQVVLKDSRRGKLAGNEQIVVH